MAGFAADDGNPTPPGLFTTQWTQLSGPATASFSDPSSATSTVTLPTGGTYVFRWTGFDGEKTTTDDMMISVIPAGSQAPAPDIVPESRSYPGSVEVVMSTTVPGGEIRYTLDGSEPTAASPIYAGPFTLTATTTVRARVLRTNLADSPITTRNYLITADSRVDDGLLVLYEFDEASGSTIKDKGPLPSPLNLSIQNYGKVTRVDSGVRIDQPTVIASSAAATKISGAVKASGEVTVELWLSPADLAQMDSMIVGLSANKNARNLAIIQEGASFDTYLRTRDTNTRGEPPTGAADALLEGMMHLVYTRAASGETAVYVNGVEVATGFTTNDLGNWINSHRLHLGAERDGGRSWLGTYYLLAFYDRVLTPAEVIQNYAFGDI